MRKNFDRCQRPVWQGVTSQTGEVGGAPSAASRSAMMSSRSSIEVPGVPDVVRSIRVRASRAASRRARARAAPASSGALGSRAVSRSSAAVTRFEATAQPPAICSQDVARRSSGSTSRANHASSPSAWESSRRQKCAAFARAAAGSRQRRRSVRRPEATTSTLPFRRPRERPLARLRRPRPPTRTPSPTLSSALAIEE